jgi:hypothetical protein
MASAKERKALPAAGSSLARTVVKSERKKLAWFKTWTSSEQPLFLRCLLMLHANWGIAVCRFGECRLAYCRAQETILHTIFW